MKRAAPGRRRLPPYLPAIAAVALLAALAFGVGVWSAFRTRGLPADSHAGVPLTALAESVKVNAARKDWVGALHWMRSVTRRAPHDAYALTELSVCLHNAATGERVRNGRRHPALRNSLQRIEAELQALAIADSAMREAGDVKRWTRAVQWHGEVLENLGCVSDALISYQQILERTPEARTSRARAFWIESHLRDPGAPDRLQLPAEMRRRPAP